MKTFRQFNESFNVQQFPHIRLQEPKRLVKLIEYLNQYEGQDVPNPVFQTIKGLVNYIVDKATDIHTNAPDGMVDRLRAANWPFAHYDYDVSYINNVAGKLKKVEGGLKNPVHPLETEFLTWLRPVLQDLNVIALAMDELKKRVVKRVAKVSEDPHAKYVAPMAKQASGKLVIDALTTMTEAMYGDYADAVAKWLSGEVEKIAALPTRDDQRKSKNQILAQHHLWQERGFSEKRLPMQPVENYKALCVIAGQEAADDMQREFVIKNAKKLALIIERKNAPMAGAPQILRASAGNRGTFEGTMRIAFTDGSSFEVRNQVVFKRNQYGTFFTQYPTTFHSVILPDGSKLSQPSEERMNNDFTSA